MDASSLLQLFNFSVPTVMTFLALLFIFVLYLQSKSHSRTGHLKLLICYFAAMALDWSLVDLHVRSPKTYMYLNGVFYANYILQTVIFAHFIFLVTKLDSKERFSYLNYILPAAILLIWAIWSSLIPYQAKLDIITSYGLESTQYSAYLKFLVSNVPVSLLTFTIYTVWSALRLYRYRKNILGVISPPDRKLPRLDWLGIIIVMNFISIPLHLITTFGNASLAVAMVIVVVIMYILSVLILCYNLMIGNYRLVSKDESEDRFEADAKKISIEVSTENSVPAFNVRIDKKFFEKYISENKPHLSSTFRINDLARALGTNRTYVSIFIKSTYGTNFSNYFNNLRLEEFDRISALPGRSRDAKVDIASEVGFGSYKSYMRAREQRNTLER